MLNMKQEYFKAGRDWYVERYESAHIQSNRWFVAFLSMSILAIVLTAAIIILVPLKTYIPLVIHQNTQTGELWVDRPKTIYAPENDAQIQSDIVRYIASRESYSAADINQRFHLVMLLSDNAISRDYESEQSNGNKKSPVNTLGETGTRTVHIEDIVFLDKAGIKELRHFRTKSSNLAKVDFTTTTTDVAGNKKQDAFVATISWTYQGIPESKQDAWDNWNGFTVLTYRVDPRNVGN
jgi:type IV secretion system protein VirB8